MMMMSVNINFRKKHRYISHITSIFFCHPVGSCNAADKHQSIVQERTGKMVKMYQVLVQSFKKNYCKCRV